VIARVGWIDGDQRQGAKVCAVRQSRRRRRFGFRLGLVGEARRQAVRVDGDQ
jgi:hypothetical protein